MEPQPRLTPKEAVLLKLLRVQPSIGIQLARDSNGEISINAVYITLKRLAAKKFVESCELPTPGVPQRLYSLTSLGRTSLEAFEMVERARGE